MASQTFLLITTYPHGRATKLPPSQKNKPTVVNARHQHQAAGVEPPKPLAKREKEIAADLTTAQDTRNHTVDAPAQVAVLNAPEINTDGGSSHRTSKAASSEQDWADTARKAGEDTDARNDPFSLFGHRARYAKPQERAEVHEQLPDTLYDEEHTRGPEYDFEDRTAIQYVEKTRRRWTWTRRGALRSYCPSPPLFAVATLQSHVPVHTQQTLWKRNTSVPTRSTRPCAVRCLRVLLLLLTPSLRRVDSPWKEAPFPLSIGGTIALPGPQPLRRPAFALTVGAFSTHAGTQVDAEFTPTHGCTRSRCSPLPASSPPPVFESDFDDGEDDYGKQEEEREKKRLKALTRGGRFSPSLEDEEEFEAEVAQNGLDDEEMPPKGREVSLEVQVEEARRRPEDPDNIGGDPEASSVGEPFKGDVRSWQGKWQVGQDILSDSRSPTEEYRATSAGMCFSGYSQVKGNPAICKGLILRGVKAAFLAACGPDAKWGKDTLDMPIPWLDEWQKGIAAQAGKMLLENYGVHMIGSIVDIDGQASLYFGVGDDYKEFRDRHKMVLGQQMKNMEHEFGLRVMDRRKRALEAHDQPPLIEFTGNLAGRDKEKIRDMHQRAFARIMGGMLQRHQKAIGAIPDDVDAQQYKMKWGLHPLRREEDQDGNLQKFLPGLVKSARVDKRDNGDDDGKDEDDEIVVWDEDELALPLEDQRDIPLVISVGGAALRCVKHSPVYDKALQKEREKTKRAAEKKAKKAEKTERKRRRSSSRPARAKSQNDANTHDDRGRPEQSSRKDANSYSNQRDLDNYRDSKRSRRQPPSPGPQPSPHDADRRVRDDYRGSKLSRRRSSSRRSLSPHSPQRSRHDPLSLPLSHANRQPNHHHDSKLGRGAVAAESSRQHAQGARSKAGAPYPARSTGPKEPNHRAHPPPARSQATYQDLPHIDFSHSAALDARVTPARHAIKRKGPDIAEAESKRQRRVDEEQHFAGLSTMVEGQQRFILHFIIGRDGGEKFFARGFDNVKTSSRADNATFIRHPETGKYHPLPSGTTPILATQNDRGIYASEIRKWSLYNSQ
ncbi:hypothetical protein B0H13DRAFT_1885621 [Mycena leptocephala]|nr:hypothetical protein B0H13DRAFT_1885621 [Mycena leptocephala]